MRLMILIKVETINARGLVRRAAEGDEASVSVHDYLADFWALAWGQKR